MKLKHAIFALMAILSVTLASVVDLFLNFGGMSAMVVSDGYIPIRDREYFGAFGDSSGPVFWLSITLLIAMIIMIRRTYTGRWARLKLVAAPIIPALFFHYLAISQLDSYMHVGDYSGFFRDFFNNLSYALQLHLFGGFELFLLIMVTCYPAAAFIDKTLLGITQGVKVLNKNYFISLASLLLLIGGVWYLKHSSKGETDISGILNALEAREPAARANALKELDSPKNQSVLWERRDELVTALKKRLADTDLRVRYDAVELLAKLGGDMRYLLPYILEMSEASDPDDRKTAINRLKQEVVSSYKPELLGKKEEIKSAVKKRLYDTDKKVRYEAVIFLAGFHPVDMKFLAPFALKMLEAREPEYRKEALDELWQWYDKPESQGEKKEMLAAFKKMTHDPDKMVRFEAVQFLTWLPEGDRKRYIPFMIELLEAREPEMRKKAAAKLGDWGDVPELREKKGEIISALKKRLKDTDKSVRYEAVESLAKIDTGDIKYLMPFIIEMLKEKESTYDFYAVLLCSRIGPRAAETVPTLIEIKNKKESVTERDDIIGALKSIGTPEALAGIKPTDRLFLNLDTMLESALANIIVALCFASLFLWSVRLRKRGKKVFHWLLLLPVLIHIYAALDADKRRGVNFTDVHFFILNSSIALIPWIISWFFVRRVNTPSKT